MRGFAGRGIELMELPHAGKPAALSAGIERSKGEILVLTDARQTLEPDSVRQLVACFSDPTVGAVSGDLPMRPGGSDEQGSTSLYWLSLIHILKRDPGTLGIQTGQPH